MLVIQRDDDMVLVCFYFVLYIFLYAVRFPLKKNTVIFFTAIRYDL